MKKQKPAYYYLLVLTVILTAGAVVTLLPHAGASKVNLLGYKSVCSNVPVSTIVCLLGAALVCFIRKKNVKV